MNDPRRSNPKPDPRPHPPRAAKDMPVAAPAPSIAAPAPEIVAPAHETDTPSPLAPAVGMPAPAAPQRAGTRMPDQSRSLWLRPASARSFPELEQDLRVDVAVVGAGITGITAATLLKAAGRTVALIDARRVAQGETLLTTAHLTQCTDTRLHQLARDFGADGARAVWDSSAAALAQIETLISTRGIDCARKRVDGWLYTTRLERVAELEKEHDAARALGIPLALVRADVPLPFAVQAALRYENQAQFHVRDYLLPLASDLPGGGSHVFENTPALEIQDQPEPCVVTRSGVIRARDVIVATNVPINNRVLLQTKIAHYRSYAIAARVRDAVAPGLFWDDEDPYHYVRTHDVDGHTYLIAGGEDHRTGQAADTLERFDRLAAWTSERFPIGPVEFRWSGQIVEPVDGLPYIGRNSFSEHVWEATGYAGNGMTFGTLAGMILCDLVLGQPNPWSALYDATRIKPIAAARDYVKENLSFPKHFVGDRLKHESSDLDALPRGCGGVFSVEGRKMAAWRDAGGELHAFSPVCPHLGCHVDFNAAETTWDCPCHGSRFDVHGNVLNGPATRGLEALPRIPLDPEARPLGGGLESAPA